MAVLLAWLNHQAAVTSVRLEQAGDKAVRSDPASAAVDYRVARILTPNNAELEDKLAVLAAVQSNPGQTSLLYGQTDSAAAAIAKAVTLLTEPGTAERLSKTKQILQQGVGLEPGNLRLHQLMLEVARKQKDKVEAAKQQRLIEQLQNGKV